MKSVDLNFVLTISGFAIGIVGVVLSIYFFYKSKKRKILAYANKTIFYVTGKHKDIDVWYKGQSIDKLSYQVFEFQNSGNTTIKSVDIPDNEPLKISSTENSKIIGAEIHKMINCEVWVENMVEDFSEVKICFKYLSVDSAFTVNVFTISETDSEVIVSGNVLDGKLVSKISVANREELKTYLNTAKLFLWITVISFIAAFLPDRMKTIFIIFFTCLNLIMFFVMAFILKGQVAKIKEE